MNRFLRFTELSETRLEAGLTCGISGCQESMRWLVGAEA